MMSLMLHPFSSDHPTPSPQESMDEQLQLHFENLKDWLEVKFEKIDESVDRHGRNIYSLASQVSNLRVEFNSFRVSTAQSMGTSQPTPRIDLPSSSAARPSSSRHDYHL